MTRKIQTQFLDISKKGAPLLQIPVYETSPLASMPTALSMLILQNNIGNAILAGMEGKTAAEYMFKWNNQAATLDTMSAVKQD